MITGVVEGLLGGGKKCCPHQALPAAGGHAIMQNGWNGPRSEARKSWERGTNLQVEMSQTLCWFVRSDLVMKEDLDSEQEQHIE